AAAVGEAGFGALAQSLVEQLDDPIWWVRFQAAGALSKLGASGREQLVQAAAHGRADARRAAALTLAEAQAA
ncbi:MAG TPA: HEAT repeat domain-containing protein, partial [Phenylobacterium sp.]